MKAYPVNSVAAALLAALLLAACSRGPDAETVAADLQKALDTMDEGLVRVAALNPQGTGPGPQAGELVAYANVELELERAHDFGAWEGVTVGTLASTLGATDRGVRGIGDDGNAAGDRLRVYASAVYEAREGGWHFRGGAAPGQRAAASALPAGEGAALTAQLESIVARMQLDEESSRAWLVQRTVSRALADVQRQVAAAESGLIVAAGPVGGEYATIASGLVPLFARLGRQLAVFHSDGSVDNARLVQSGDVSLGIVQSDVLVLAQSGRGPFAPPGRPSELAALASLYPEPVQIVVPADSPIEAVADLAGKRVALGEKASGTRYSAGRVLEAHGVAAGELGFVDDSDLEMAAARLTRGEIDAMFATIGAPAGVLRRLAARRAIRLLALEPSAVDRLVASTRAYVRHVIPRSTYRGQLEPVPTVATTAVLVARRDAPDGLVEDVLRVVFFELDYEAAGSLQGGMIAPRTGRRGLPLALHGEAQRFFDALPGRHR